MCLWVLPSIVAMPSQSYNQPFGIPLSLHSSRDDPRVAENGYRWVFCETVARMFGREKWEYRYDTHRITVSSGCKYCENIKEELLRRLSILSLFLPTNENPLLRLFHLCHKFLNCPRSPVTCMNLTSFFAYAGVSRRSLKLLHNFTLLLTSGFILGLTSCLAVYEE
jgi:hypothetical protein